MARDLNMNYVRIGSLRVAKALHEFIEQGPLRERASLSEAFWSGFAGLLLDYRPRNRQLLQVRGELQSRIDQYHHERSDEPFDLGHYETSADRLHVCPDGFADRPFKLAKKELNFKNLNL